MSSEPKRIQRKRTRGWRMPEGAVYVGRPTKWGNPLLVAEGLLKGMTQAEIVEEYRSYIGSVEQAVECARKELRGKDLACWCPIVDKDGNPVPCHADVLLEIANS